MNHQAHYDLLIKKAITRKIPDGYVEKHHIIPKCLGGSNDKSNIVVLTGREHFIAHMLLAKIHGGGLWQASKMMMKFSKKNKQKRYVNSKLYEIAKKEWKNFLIGKKRPSNIGDAIRKSRIGSFASEKTKLKMSEVRKGKPRSGDPAKWKHSDAAKKKMSESKKGKPSHMQLEKYKERMRGENNPMKSEINRKKISEAKKLYWANKRMNNLERG